MANPRFSLNHSSFEILFYAWVILDLLLLVPMMALLGGTFPVFTLLWLVVPLLVMIWVRDPGRVGFRAVPWQEFWRVTAINFGLWLLLMLLVEPWSHVYHTLLHKALSASPPDTTFAWVVHYPGLTGLLGMVLYTALISIFAEELFFRGWLLQALLLRLPRRWAISLQAVLFVLPQALAAFLFPPLQAALWIVIYSWLAVGVIGGWAAARTGSIWPSLVSAVLMNLLLTAVLV